ncbi:MAG: hypothetical protein IPM89_04925 [Candidatus Competibacteraceae bacterium]|nr:MAG: hypothetical protein IPM89_04925 [Candidatus Competibacteraceae bacterium]
MTADVGLIRVVVRREAPSNQRIAIRRPVSRARSVRETSDYMVSVYLPESAIFENNQLISLVFNSCITFIAASCHLSNA